MTSRPSIRTASAGDANAVAACVRAAYVHYVERIGRPPAPMLDDYARVLRERAVFIVDCEDRPCAGVLVLQAEDRALLVHNVAVHPEMQGRGLGRQLMAFAHAEAERLDLSEIRLYTNERMTENIALYGRLGFVETDRRVEDGYARVFMSKTITSPNP